MQHFQPILIAIGILAIVGVLIHGFLLNRKNKLASKEEKLDALAESNESKGEKLFFSESGQADDIDPSLDIEALDNQLDVDSSQTQQTVIGETDEAPIASMTEPVEIKPEPAQTQPKDLFIFNVVAKDELNLGGHKLLQFFLTSGFRYGEMNIFHRHEHSDGTGEVLFSIANMMAPGTFDLDEMEQFNTKGISFFLTAPNPKISVKQSFDLMLRAVVQLADEFDCDVLNEQREPLTESQFIEYRNRLQQYP